MELSNLHLLLTYRCDSECDHCFVWGGPKQEGTLTIKGLKEILRQGKSLKTVKSIFFEGGEPLLYYPILLKGARMASEMGFDVGLVSNGYWATSVEDAVEWLKPLAGFIDGISVSTDLFHCNEKLSRQAKNAGSAAKKLGIHIGFLQIAQPEDTKIATNVGQLPPGWSGVMFRGRAAVKLVDRVPHRDWRQFTSCPYENLRNPGRVHIDPLGYLHLCQGISIGNLFKTPLGKLSKDYNPDTHPITGPLLKGGPVQLARKYGLRHKKAYADACHMCYEMRLALRKKFPGILTPGQMYGTLQ
jgi:hypothetical protein